MLIIMSRCILQAHSCTQRKLTRQRERRASTVSRRTKLRMLQRRELLLDLAFELRTLLRQLCVRDRLGPDVN